MNKKFLMAGVLSGIAAFFLGWFIFGIILMDFYTANTTVYPGLIREDMNYFTILLGNLIWGFLLAWIYMNAKGRKSVRGGALTGVITGLLVYGMLDLHFFGWYNLFTPKLLLVDTLVNGVWSAGVGAVVGFILRNKE